MLNVASRCLLSVWVLSKFPGQRSNNCPLCSIFVPFKKTRWNNSKTLLSQRGFMSTQLNDRLLRPLCRAEAVTKWINGVTGLVAVSQDWRDEQQSALNETWPINQSINSRIDPSASVKLKLSRKRWCAALSLLKSVEERRRGGFRCRGKY